MRKFHRQTTHAAAVPSSRPDLTITEMFEVFMKQKRLAGLAPRTLDEYEQHFAYMMSFLGRDLQREEVTAEVPLSYISWMVNERRLAPMTVNIRIRTMRAFFRFAFKEGYIDYPVHQKMKLLKTEEDTIESFTPAEIKLLLSVIDVSKYVGFRDYVMILVLLDTMVRISELLSMQRRNVDLMEGSIRLDAMGTKTRRARTVPISTRTKKLLQEYIQETDDFGDDTLFLTYDGRPLNPYSWRDRLREYGDLAGIRHKRVSPHTFRHTGALFYILNGGDPFSLQKILGHTDMSMVRKYIQMTGADIKRQHNAYSPLNNLKL